mmetsp:Transcript_15891/g.37483  ORF Transcript_15891/g.37483 Transcript_15891/m.37483 type:complete len:345 (-) Transcript_15891:75-1109(-)
MTAEAGSQHGEAAASTVVRRWSGPAGPASRLAGWDSALMEMRRNAAGVASEGSSSTTSSFTLELWRFYEAWRIPPEKLETDGTKETTVSVKEADEIQAERSVNGRSAEKPRASQLVREEVRVTCRGSFVTSETPALHFCGFQHEGLNQGFAAWPHLRVAGLPTWWSQDGCYFIYYAEEYGHWKMNARRGVGGDGVSAVRLGERRAGRGFAHSGPAPMSSPEAAAEVLQQVEGWYEVMSGEWDVVYPTITACTASTLDFVAQSVSVEEVSAAGEDVWKRRHSAKDMRFGGIQHAESPSTLLYIPPGLGSAGDEPGMLTPVSPSAEDCDVSTEPDVMSLKLLQSKL